MRDLGLQGVRRGRGVRTTIRDDGHERADDLLQRDFTASCPNERWVADFTHVSTWSGIVYVAFVVDVFFRAIVGWSAATSKRAKLVLDAPDMALWRRDRAGNPAGPGLIHHSDAGGQGGFNRSLQHLVLGGVDGQASRVDGVVDRTVADEVPGCAGASAGSGTSILAGNREGGARRGGGSCGWRIPGGGLQVVPSRWRHATNGSCSAVRPVPVLSRA
jgi:putative transposase